VVGLEVPHAHIHLIPLNKMEDMNFRNERLKLRKNIQKFKTQLLILKKKKIVKAIFYDFL
jgi:diadenosine tetraphosphate (Ap4A) HIT family hydrolase